MKHSLLIILLLMLPHSIDAMDSEGKPLEDLFPMEILADTIEPWLDYIPLVIPTHNTVSNQPHSHSINHDILNNTKPEIDPPDKLENSQGENNHPQSMIIDNALPSLPPPQTTPILALHSEPNPNDKKSFPRCAKNHPTRGVIPSVLMTLILPPRTRTPRKNPYPFLNHQNIICHMCDLCFSSIEELNVHLPVHLAEKMHVQCHHCNIRISKYSLSTHLRRKHNVISQ